MKTKWSYRSGVILQKQRPIQEAVYYILKPSTSGSGFDYCQVGEVKSEKDVKQIVDTVNRIAALEENYKILQSNVEGVLYRAKRAAAGHDGNCSCGLCEARNSIAFILQQDERLKAYTK
jgi:hypothetical protein